MPHKIERLSSVTSTYTVTDDVSQSPKIPFGAAAGGIIIIDSAEPGTDALFWHVAFGPEELPVPAKDGASDVVTPIAPGTACAVPDALFAAPFITATTNGESVTFRMCVKG